ncbi:RtcB family protein, partial [bacterium]
ETWFGRSVLVHRKGAVAASAGARVLIPGSMGTASYLATGLGSDASFGSCSHGAGRVLSRSAARSVITPKALQRAMHGIVYPRGLARSLVEEAPAAYRDIDAVLEDQADLVRKETRLRPVAVLKG